MILVNISDALETFKAARMPDADTAAALTVAQWTCELEPVHVEAGPLSIPLLLFIGRAALHGVDPLAALRILAVADLLDNPDLRDHWPAAPTVEPAPVQPAPPAPARRTSSAAAAARVATAGQPWPKLEQVPPGTPLESTTGAPVIGPDGLPLPPMGWIDAGGTLFDHRVHSWSRELERPSVTPAGRFRVRRGTAQTAPAAAQAAPTPSTPGAPTAPPASAAPGAPPSASAWRPPSVDVMIATLQRAGSVAELDSLLESFTDGVHFVGGDERRVRLAHAAQLEALQESESAESERDERMPGDE